MTDQNKLPPPLRMTAVHDITLSQSFLFDCSSKNCITALLNVSAQVQNPVLRIERKCVPLCVEPKVYTYVNRVLSL